MTPELRQIEQHRKRIAAEQAKIAAIRAACPHQWEIVKPWNDSDGYSQVTVTYYYDLKCRRCELCRTVPQQDFKHGQVVVR
jgi:hypothetical protein